MARSTRTSTLKATAAVPIEVEPTSSGRQRTLSAKQQQIGDRKRLADNQKGSQVLQVSHRCLTALRQFKSKEICSQMCLAGVSQVMRKLHAGRGGDPSQGMGRLDPSFGVESNWDGKKRAGIQT
ncbi:uncharacterized protein LACBIDRAFT_336274 [Laccaria bicolor S238N-H82]|uniref:Predicted protein n=1 Tax=Laccaria bicolor (strain S238N-H82 / ATCC MYA-4686) TaxID=486041 RepID=B0E4Y5_LACBS|nr:uncharacterized protein LACBIDRAFT_336274 [Laccaria bicolor S238N-H82]EDQ98096.1 predicted protein [Laccaria bicolor S238N-H82]|eukprot:XP_001891253.1 predicted protein [Laccaria bicolor S238N-H82]